MVVPLCLSCAVTRYGTRLHYTLHLLRRRRVQPQRRGNEHYNQEVHRYRLHQREHIKHHHRSLAVVPIRLHQPHLTRLPSPALRRERPAYGRQSKRDGSQRASGFSLGNMAAR